MECQSLLDYDYVSPHFKLRRRQDVASLDGRDIVSARFREFCLASKYREIEFVPLDLRRGLYEMRPQKVVRIDQSESRPDFTNLCPKCGQFECMNIGRGIFLEDGDKPLADGFYRTDLNWACSAGKWPMTIIGLKTAAKIKAAGFKHYYVKAVPYLNPYWRGPKAAMEDHRKWVESVERAKRRLKER
jgi:hypothetical protein